MKKITKNIKRRNNLILLAVLSLLLVGCSSEATTKPAKSEPEAVVKEEAPKVEESTVPETIVEETVVEEPTEDLYIPEGIDMESTLPGEEWVASFVGKVAEPVVVIYNDNTGRKEVVQVGSKVTVNPDEDIFAIYCNEIDMGATTHAISVKDLEKKDYYRLLTMDSEKMRKIPERDAKVTVMGGPEDWVLEFTIIVE